MGRSVFKVVLEDATGDGFERAFRRLYLYGIAGVGKSHLLAALVFALVQNGNRVVYIPDCLAAVADPYRYLQAALLFAYHGDDDSQGAVAGAEDIRDLINVIRAQPDKSLYLVVDQFNALDVDIDNTDPGKGLKTVLYEALESIGDRQKHIFSASANVKSNQVANKKQTGNKVIRLNAGMTRVRPHTFSFQTVLSYIPRMRRILGLNTMSPGSPKNTATMSRI